MRRCRHLLLAAALCLLVACQGPDATEMEAEGGAGFQAGDGSVTVIPSQDRQPAPELTGDTLDDEEVSLDDFLGQAVVVNVWGSWCAPCRAEAPDLVAASKELEDVQFLGINTRDLDPGPARAFVRAFDVPYPNIYDPDGSLLLGFKQLPPKAIPSTIILDEEGRVAARILGAASAATLIGVVEDVQE